MDNDIIQALQQLQSGGIILYPTDTVWGLGCDATNVDAVAKIYALKQRKDSKALIVLLPNIAQLKQYVTHIPPLALEILQQNTRPTTIIYNQVQHIAHNLKADDGSVAIRLPQHHFCQTLLNHFGKPIVSTSANISGEPTPMRYADISENIINACDFVVSSQLENNGIARPSTILRIMPNDEIITIRA